MVDGLSNEERIIAWLASWSPSFEGKAIVNPDFTFRSVNSQFCKVLGVTPAELVGNTFADLTPQPVKDIDIANANLVMKGVMESYLMEKTYEFRSGRRVDVTLLVNGAYHPRTGDFMFFVSTIMARKRITSSVPLSQMPTGLLEWVDKKKVGWAIITIIATLIAASAEKITKLITGG